jgi:hypothetical protein
VQVEVKSARRKNHRAVKAERKAPRYANDAYTHLKGQIFGIVNVLAISYMPPNDNPTKYGSANKILIKIIQKSGLDFVHNLYSTTKWHN